MRLIESNTILLVGRTLSRFPRIAACCMLLASTSMIAIASTGVDATEEQSRKFSKEALAEMDALHAISDIYLKAGTSAFDEGDYAVAERVARNGLAVIHDDDRLLRLRGESLLRLGINDEALRVFKQINDSSHDRNSFARIGLLTARLGQYQESSQMTGMGLLEQVLPNSLLGYTVKPNNPRNIEVYWLLSLGMIAETHANDEEAIYFHSQAQELLPSHLVANSRLGKIHMQQKNYEKAADYYSRIRTGPEKIVLNAKQQLKIARDRVAKAMSGGSGG